MNPYIFREYDIRGIVDEDLTEEVVEELGRGFGTYLRGKGGRRASLGGDVRLSTPKFREAITRGMISSGLNVVDIGVVPTPVQYFSLYHLNVDGGVMITGSHNPPQFNGFKLAVGKATIYGEQIQEVRKIIEQANFSSGRGNLVRKDIVGPYQERLGEEFSFNKRLMVVVDAGNGTGGIFVPGLLRALGCEVIELYCEPDGHFPNHHPDPTVVDYMRDLIEKVKETKADVGFAYDGDADRIGVVDEEGRIIWGDYLLILFSREILREKSRKIIFEVKCSQALVEEIERMGGEPIMWKTGHSLLKEKLRETGAALAGEMSGHIFFADRYFGYDDAIYTTCRLLEVMDRSDLTLSQMLQGVPRYFSTPEIRAECRNDKEKFEIAQKAKEYFSSKYQTITVDGVRVLFGDGWGLVRASNTQPVLVLRFEARSEARLEEIRSIVIGKLREFGEVDI